ncbi:hypothetical protein [Nonlabens dokdonensis]|nr:hypothetical protein [Nonlabens dokdonensis]
MKSKEKDDCCNGCQNGQPGKNPSCQAKLMIEELNRKKELIKNTTS